MIIMMRMTNKDLIVRIIIILMIMLMITSMMVKTTASSCICALSFNKISSSAQSFDQLTAVVQEPTVQYAVGFHNTETH